ncbi:octaprenyl diphosphate synthase [Pseudohongiella acticola]|jgi:octaprenyl-diphosphate synthase|uniref:Octaprenyl diphosphate synthase n=1 Tax=Pseudohongiella acticola TaxID=1524254 RepID=A0A1E8CH31_9GAMM|nr:polyprenyl synthetase family protein [Pseudohongiella acticola]OFE11625.1 octaprenyl diphosphate synthase [Pseudohongiella acticola]
MHKEAVHNTIRAIVATDFEAVNEFIVEQLHSNVDLVENIGHYIINAGGKRMRPILVLLSARSCGATNDDAVKLAAVIEFIHTATLLHDDVVDMSAMRRGRPTANEQWNNPSSVLVGDFIYSRAFQVMVRIGNMDVMQVMADTTNVIAEGEVLQLLNKHRTDTSEADYMRVIRDKTAVLFEAAAYCGAIVAGAPTETQQALKAAGMHLGMAFQLVDDVLDYDGDASEMGKNIGDDLAEGKPTLPLIHALQQSSGADKTLLEQSIINGGPENLDQVIRIIRNSGALAYTRQKAHEQADLARAQINTLPDSSYRTGLLQMCEMAVARVS